MAGGHRPQFAAEHGLGDLRAARPRARRAAARPLRGRGGVRAAVALRGLRPAGARGDGRRHAGRGGAHGGAAGDLRRRRAARARPTARRSATRWSRCSRDAGRARAPARRRARARRRLHVGRDGARRRRRDGCAAGRWPSSGSHGAAARVAPLRAALEPARPAAERRQRGGVDTPPVRSRRSPDQSNALGPVSVESHVYQKTRSIRWRLRAAARSRSALPSRRAWPASVTSKPRRAAATLPSAAGQRQLGHPDRHARVAALRITRRA